MIKRRVIKVGGSLLALNDLPDRIHAWISSAPKRQNIFLMGGGNFCNELRNLDQRFDLPESTSHELCLVQMKVTALLLARLLDLQVTDRIEAICATDCDVVFDCHRWMNGLDSVPQTWEVTSDSISALLASELNSELCLMKSVDVGDAKTGDVDNYFATASQDIVCVSFINLKEIES